MNYSRALRTCRAARGLHQQDLAHATGLTKGHISLIESGKRSPSSATLTKLCAALHIPQHLFVLLAADPEDLQERPTEEVSLLAMSLLEILTSPGEPRDGSAQARLL